MVFGSSGSGCRLNSIGRNGLAPVSILTKGVQMLQHKSKLA